MAAILGTVAYGAAGSALAEVLSPQRLERFGPATALIALAIVARWGAYQGPVVFTMPDVAFLLGAPLPRRAMTVRRLVLTLACGALAGAAVAGIVLVGLADVTTRDVGVIVACLAELGMLGVAAAWAVERSARWERVAWLASWPAFGAAAALAAWAPGIPILPALTILSVLTVAAAAEAVRDCGHCSAERHQRRAEARESAIASLGVYDLRTARRSLEAARPTTARPGGVQMRRLPVPAIAWRDAVAAVRAPGRVVEAFALSAAAAAVASAHADRPLVVAAAMLAGYLGAARMLWPLRSELDIPARARVLLRPRLSRVLLEHLIVPAVTTVLGATLGAVALAIAGHGGATVAVAAIGAAPLLTLCAAMSARRGGRMPQSLLVTATTADPTGGGTAIAGWFAWWPSVAVVGAGAPVALAGAGAAAPAALCFAAVGAALTWLAGRDVDPELS